MNRSLANVILGGYGSSPSGPAAKIEGVHTEVDVPGAAEALANGAPAGGCRSGWLGRANGARSTHAAAAAAAAASHRSRAGGAGGGRASPAAPPTAASPALPPSLPCPPLVQPRRC